MVLPEGNIHLTLSSLRKFAAQKQLYTQLVDGAVLKSGVMIRTATCCVTTRAAS